MHTRFIRVSLVVICQLLAIADSNGQHRPTVVMPQPQMSWDSLKHQFNYPKLQSRAGLDALYFVRLSIDSTGGVTYCKVRHAINQYDDTVFVVANLKDSAYYNFDVVKNIEKSILSAKWNPGTVNGRRYPMTIRLPIYFHAYTESTPRVLLIETWAQIEY